MEYRNNQDVIDLIAKKPTGLLIILEEQVCTYIHMHMFILIPLISIEGNVE